MVINSQRVQRSLKLQRGLDSSAFVLSSLWRVGSKERIKKNSFDSPDSLCATIKTPPQA